MLSDITYFDRTGEAGVSIDVTGFRTDLYPAISYPIRTQSAYVIPKVGVRYHPVQPGPSKVLSDKSPSRTLPVISVDSGLFLERVTSRLQPADFLHTLEPRLHYLYIPARGPVRPAGIRFVHFQPGLQRPVPGKQVQRL